MSDVMTLVTSQLARRDRPMRRGGGRRRRTGFTLIEAAMTTVIIGVGVLALIELLTTGTVSNVRGTETTTGLNLAKNIREQALEKTFAQLQAMHNVSFSPPVDSRGVALAGLTGWTQTVKVESVDPNLLTTPLADASPQALRITATVTHGGRKVCDLSWFSFAGPPIP